VNSRMSKWLLFACATFMLGACSADSSVLGPEAVPAEARPAVGAPSRSVMDSKKPNVSDDEVESNGRGRYAMAAS
jgi:hypothetical protein